MKEQMKSSGIDWIGNIPLDWNAKKVKYVISDIKDGTHGTFDRVESGELLLSAKNVFDDGIRIGENESEISILDYKSIISNGFPKRNDVLLCCVGTIGRCCVYEYDQSIAFQRSVAFLRPLQQTNARYLKYALQSDSTLIQEQFLINKSAQDGLYMGSVRELIIPYPNSKSEQQAIADFLDKECAQIDSIAADLEKQIALLQQYKKSLITETVTKGLDKSVPMKDSGVEWLGKIPAHWDFKRLKFMLESSSDSMKVGPFGSALSGSDFTDEGKWVYNQRVVLDNNFSENTTFVSEEKFQEMRSFAVYPGDILITTRGTIGKVAIVPEGANEGILHPCIIKFRVDKEMIIPELLQLIFNESDFVKDQFTLMSNATTIEVIYSYSLKDILLPVIPADEQEKIYAYLSKKCIAIDGIIAEKQKALATITQHKKSLIYEYVTGKKRVKEVQ
ncbi:restriction endonuclease subunit S [Bittarella massiliensis (ex Durand et al. 2017)]|uniref:Restriction endonuclease subunit S n=1 Tax=Bittarella massiliensis (ex Durand et al. 2017) TaxID=1720313 RepID=A0AAW5K6J3_9FIRM|nr:restriction endonuclease subunit S [Bittarella massiliensis (ex Durand et al. 2017)]MCQ4948626.1 restriction endonuclease subunit S [Bittarella massiliensis (ex Durand et al. 2017)]